jgi:hypothetical protein
MQVERNLETNQTKIATKEAVEAERESLIVGED